MMNPEILTRKIYKEGTDLEKIHYKIGRFYYKEEYEETNNNYVKIIGLKYKFNFLVKINVIIMITIFKKFMQ